MDRGAWWATVHGITESGTTEMTKHTRIVINKPAAPSPRDCETETEISHSYELHICSVGIFSITN